MRDAVPVGYLPSGAAAPAPAGQYVMGTITRVETVRQEVVLNNGTVVYVGPNAMLRSGAGRLAITQLRPGDEILVQVTNPVAPATVVTTAPVPAAADRYAGGALPYQGYAVTRIEAADVIVVWSPQAR